jgi:hypothetical protein
LRTFWPNNKIAIPCPTNNTLFRVTLSYLISWWNHHFTSHLPTLHESHMCPVPINRCSSACRSRVLFSFQTTNICSTAWIPSSLKSRQHFHLSSLSYALPLSHHPFLTTILSTPVTPTLLVSISFSITLCFYLSVLYSFNQRHPTFEFVFNSMYFLTYWCCD